MKVVLARLFFKIYFQFGRKLKKFVPSCILNFGKKLIKFLTRGNHKNKVKDYSMPKGVNLIGYIKAEMGLGHGCRLFADALELSGISWCAISDEKLQTVRFEEKTWEHKIVPEPIYNFNIFHINPDNIQYSSLYLPDKLWSVPYSIGICAWELSQAPREWAEGIKFFDEIWTNSNFEAEALKTVTDKPVICVPYGILVEDFDQYNRKHFGLREKIFLFLIMFDVNSTFERKNPLGAIKAFKMAFSPQQKDVGIIIKINNSQIQNKNKIEALKDSLKSYSNVFFIEQTLSRAEINSLIFCSDCFVSLHRSEGFGLVIAEAMYLSKPVIVTNWSGNVDFTNPDNACVVDYSLIKIEKDSGPYKAGFYWAEPDYEQAAKYMKKVTADEDYRNKISQNASSFIKENFSHENCSNIIKSRLKELAMSLN